MSPVTSVIARSAVVPVLGEPTLRAEQVTQLVLGETAQVEEITGEWRRVVTDFDRYQGWVHAGYLLEASGSEVVAWQRDATGWSEGATLELGDGELRVPLRARLVVAGEGRVRLPDGRIGRVVSGAIQSRPDAVALARATPPAEWASEWFDGTSYLWGGVTPWGVDCSGLVQTTFAARGIALPRDASQQIEYGIAIAFDDVASGDLLFFRSETGPHITHVAFAGPAGMLVHSAVARGGVAVESRTDDRNQALMQRLVAVRRIEPSS